MERRVDSIGEILTFAIERERDAARGYKDLALRARSASARAFLLRLRDEEIDHERRLLDLDPKGISASPGEGVPDLRISDFVVAEPVGENPSYQDLLLFAAKKEAKAVALYTALAGRTAAAPKKALFEFLAGQEKRHKLRLELEYEGRVLPEN